MKEYFRLLLKENKPDEPVSIIPPGKFLVSPAGQILQDKQDIDTHYLYHDHIAEQHGLGDVHNAHRLGYIRGQHDKGSLWLDMVGKQEDSHRILRSFLSRNFVPNPEDTRFTLEIRPDIHKYFPDIGGLISFHGAEALERYIKHGKPRVVEQPSAPSQGQVAYSAGLLRKAVPEWQRQAESFTFSDLKKTLLKESWSEYDAKLGSSNRSLFDPSNLNFDMKTFLKRLRKKNKVSINLPGDK